MFSASFNKKLIFFIILLYLFSYKHSFAISLIMPLDCKYGVKCFIDGYFDNDPRLNKSRDYKCNDLTYDGKVSTNFILSSYFEMRKGVYVLASEKGTVTAVRNDMEDVRVSLVGHEAIRGKECGNAIKILHSQGYETEYCHLMKDSFLVKQGQKVVRGQKIAKVGLSGKTNFPFLEFFLKKDKNYIDPFIGDISDEDKSKSLCNVYDTFPMWNIFTENTLKYSGTILLSSGFSNVVPNSWKARNNSYDKKQFYSDNNFIAFWVDILGVKKNDKVILEFLDKNLNVIKHKEYKFTSSKQHIFNFVGNFMEKGWKVDEYKAILQLLRKTDKDIEEVILQEKKSFFVVDK